jgi:hypothetical protein
LPTANGQGSEIADPVTVELYDVDPDGRSRPDAALPVVINLPDKVLAGDPANSLMAVISFFSPQISRRFDFKMNIANVSL